MAHAAPAPRLHAAPHILHNAALPQFEHELHIDFETASEADLVEVGVDVYARDFSTRVLMVAWSLDDGDVEQWDEDSLDPFPERLLDLIRNPRVKKISHNASFERAIFRHVLECDTPPEEWHCTMAQAFMLGLPGALKKLGEILLLPPEMQKMDQGRKLITKFCKRHRATKKNATGWKNAATDPDDWEVFKEYNRQDVRTEKEAKKRMSRFPIHPNEWRLWYLDQTINERGWPIDRTMVTNAATKVREEDERLRQVLFDLTGLQNPNSDAQFKPWARRHGYPFGDMRKETVKRALELPEGTMHADLVRALQVRSSLKRTSVKKYFKILDNIAEDDRLRFTFQFAGAARTGRWSGRGAQLQNLAKPPKEWEAEHVLEDIIESVRASDWEWLDAYYGDSMKALSAVIRGAVRARPGRHLVVADLAAIEARVLAWVAQCGSMLQVFKDNRDIYKAFGVHVYKKPYEEITKTERNNSKPGALGAGYRLGGGEEKVDRKTGDLKKTGLWGYAWNMGVKLTKEEAHYSVKVFREVYPEVVQYWDALERAAKNVIRRGGIERVGVVAFEKQGPFLLLHLPSGRALHYLRPKIEMRETPWGEERWTITYEGMEDDGESKFWGRIPTHGGKLTENICQAIARDVLAHGIVEAEQEGFEVLAHVHDEIVAEEEDGSPRGVQQLCDAMTALPFWAKGLPLGAAGFTTTFYRKD